METSRIRSRRIAVRLSRTCSARQRCIHLQAQADPLFSKDRQISVSPPRVRETQAWSYPQTCRSDRHLWTKLHETLRPAVLSEQYGLEQLAWENEKILKTFDLHAL